MRAARLFEAVALEDFTEVRDQYGGVTQDWATAFEAHAEFIYNRGSEAVQAGALTGTATFKVKLRSSIQSRAITTKQRLRDIRRGMRYQIREVDGITDRRWIYLVVESGVAV